uniref:Uncharacterized protein n=1 Tax=Chromera velia CCMP2878 TaxID=1169474 RepID=A0A0K6S7X0_9ALVE|eukprot:Cvel_5264.t2-p1 / transcript=Cvel_5264.t2 / gene=Cvel_5264 / organism=Chromera_velia_CCMP2878 / gene_product=Ankyrin-1, putative / transcript_product=Ankyrin-1, putative / location=Cvel_scaffold243:23735-30762(-) / protein_length=1883 / sequence_SO=supercontig / SO=protein_coding / is_pseudo=false
MKWAISLSVLLLLVSSSVRGKLFDDAIWLDDPENALSALSIEALDVSDSSVEPRGEESQLQSVVRSGSLEDLRRLRDEGADLFSAAYVAAESNRSDILMLLHEWGESLETPVRSSSNREKTPLMIASSNGFEVAVSTLLSLGVNVSAVDNRDWTALHYAARDNKDSGSVSRILLENGAETEAQDGARRTPLFHAAYRGHVGVARQLVGHGANVTAVDRRCRAVLHFVFLRPPTREIEMLDVLASGKGDLDVNVWGGTGCSEYTPIHLAAEHASVAAMRRLLQMGADAAVLNADGLSALHIVTINRRGREAEELMSTLVQPSEIDSWVGVDVNRFGFPPTSSGIPCPQPALLIAAAVCSSSAVRSLVSLGADLSLTDCSGQSALHAAVLGSSNRDILACSETCRILIEEGGMSPDVRLGMPADGHQQPRFTALMVALQEGLGEMVGVLLDLGASVNATDETGTTALHLAAQYNLTDIVRVLIDRSADLEAEGGRDPVWGEGLRFTPLIWATQEGHTAVVEELLKGGARWDGRNARNATAVHMAAGKGSVEDLRLLVEFGADVNVRGGKTFLREWDEEATPLMLAAQLGMNDAVSFLLEKGADPHLKDNLAETALHLAARHGQHSTVGVLIREGGVHVDVKGVRDPITGVEMQKSPLMLACEGAKWQVVRVLINHFNASLTDRASDGRQALHFAASYRGLPVESASVVRSLIDRARKDGLETALSLLQDGVEGEGTATEPAWVDRPLHIAARGGAALEVAAGEMLRQEAILLHEMGLVASVDEGQERALEVLSGNGLSPLSEAALQGNLFLVESFLKAGADLHSLGRDERSVTHWAVEGGNEYVVKKILESGDREKHDGGDLTDTRPVHLAAIEGRADLIEMLLNMGADADRPTSGSQSPLMLAARAGCFECMVRLTERGGRAPVGVLIDSQIPLQPSLERLARGTSGRGIDSLEQRRVLAEFGPYPPTRDDAIAEIASALPPFDTETIPAGRQTTVGTALQLAASAGLLKTVRELIRRGAKVDGVPPPEALDNSVPSSERAKHRTPLLLATEALGIDARHSPSPSDFEKIAMALLDANASVMVRGPLACRGEARDQPVNSRTALHCAAALNSPNLITRLIRRGVNAGVRDERDSTPLMLAAQSCSVHSVRTLLDIQGAVEGLSALDRFGKHAWNYAEERCGDETSRLFITNRFRRANKEANWNECTRELCPEEDEKCEDPTPGFQQRGDWRCVPIERTFAEYAARALTDNNTLVTVIQIGVLVCLVLVAVVLVLLVPRCKPAWKDWNMQFGPVLAAVMQVNNLWTDVYFLIVLAAEVSAVRRENEEEGEEESISRDLHQIARPLLIITVAHLVAYIVFNICLLVRFQRRCLRGQPWWKEVCREKLYPIMLILGSLSLHFFALCATNLFGLPVLSMYLHDRCPDDAGDKRDSAELKRSTLPSESEGEREEGEEGGGGEENALAQVRKEEGGVDLAGGVISSSDFEGLQGSREGGRTGTGGKWGGVGEREGSRATAAAGFQPCVGEQADDFLEREVHESHEFYAEAVSDGLNESEAGKEGGQGAPQGSRLCSELKEDRGNGRANETGSPSAVSPREKEEEAQSVLESAAGQDQERRGKKWTQKEVNQGMQSITVLGGLFEDIPQLALRLVFFVTAKRTALELTPLVVGTCIAILNLVCMALQWCFIHSSLDLKRRLTGSTEDNRKNGIGKEREKTGGPHAFFGRCGNTKTIAAEFADMDRFPSTPAPQVPTSLAVSEHRKSHAPLSEEKGKRPRRRHRERELSTCAPIQPEQTRTVLAEESVPVSTPADLEEEAQDGRERQSIKCGTMADTGVSGREGGRIMLKTDTAGDAATPLVSSHPWLRVALGVPSAPSSDFSQVAAELGAE